MLGLAQRSQDELFHIALYNWLIQADLTDKLLEVGHASHATLPKMSPGVTHHIYSTIQAAGDAFAFLHEVKSEAAISVYMNATAGRSITFSVKCTP